MAVAVVAVAVVATLQDMKQVLPERYRQHEQAQQLADLPESDRIAASSTSIEPASFASHLPVISIDTSGQEIPGERVYAAEDETVKADSADAVAAEFGFPCAVRLPLDPVRAAACDEGRVECIREEALEPLLRRLEALPEKTK